MIFHAHKCYSNLFGSRFVLNVWGRRGSGLDRRVDVAIHGACSVKLEHTLLSIRERTTMGCRASRISIEDVHPRHTRDLPERAVG
jgi:hypothetical protein